MKRAWILPAILIWILLAAVYVVLTETLSVQNAAIGFFVSGLALYLTHSLVLKEKLFFSLAAVGHYIIYVLCLFLLIFKSAAASTASIFGKDTGVMLIRYKTALSSDYLKSMLANAITLTPGTVTADIKGDVLEVLRLGKACRKNDNAGIERMERILMRMEKRDA